MTLERERGREGGRENWGGGGERENSKREGERTQREGGGDERENSKRVGERTQRGGGREREREREKENSDREGR